MSTYSKFYFHPAKGEQINTVIRPESDVNAAIFGKIIDASDKPVSGAMVLLFRTFEEAEPELKARFCTDEDGHFMFGPLEADVLYLIKVFRNNIKIRELEVRTD